MLSRIAESLFWIGRYIERSDGTARILGARLATTSGGTGISGFYQWGVLLRAMSAFENYRKLYRDLVLPDRVAELLGVKPDQVGIKAKTPEGMGTDNAAIAHVAVLLEPA